MAKAFHTGSPDLRRLRIRFRELTDRRASFAACPLLKELQIVRRLDRRHTFLGVPIRYLPSFSLRDKRSDIRVEHFPRLPFHALRCHGVSIIAEPYSRSTL